MLREDLNEYHAKQLEYCEMKFIPCFAEEICPLCKDNIYNDNKIKEMADKELITHCPYCHYSFVE